MKSAAIILAGGKGSRLQSMTADKIMLRIGAGAVISWSVSVFSQSSVCDEIIITYRDLDQKEAIEAELKRAVPNALPIRWAPGGKQRQDSVLSALNALSESTEHVFIHDGARPFITVEDLTELKQAVNTYSAAALASPVTDTIKRANSSDQSQSLELEDLDRSRLFAMQTPQVFDATTIKQAYEKIGESKKTVTDCVDAYVRMTNGSTKLVSPSQNNFKITHPSDVELANFLIHTGSIKKVFELAYS